MMANDQRINMTAFEKFLAVRPLVNYCAGEVVLNAGSETGPLLILKSGAVAILKLPSLWSRLCHC